MDNWDHPLVDMPDTEPGVKVYGSSGEDGETQQVSFPYEDYDGER